MIKKLLLSLALLCCVASLSAQNLNGTYKFRKTAIEYHGVDMLVAMAVQSFRPQLDLLYTQNGLTEGKAFVQFKPKNRFTSWVVTPKGNNTINGTYIRTENTVVFTWKDASKTISVEGKITATDNATFTLLFDAVQTARTLRTVAPELLADPQIAQVITLLETIPGLFLGAEFGK